MTALNIILWGVASVLSVTYLAIGDNPKHKELRKTARTIVVALIWFMIALNTIM